MIQQIVKFMNQKLDKFRPSYNRGQWDCRPTHYEELLAFLGLLYMLGMKKANHAHTSEMCVTEGTTRIFKGCFEPETILFVDKSN